MFLKTKVQQRSSDPLADEWDQANRVSVVSAVDRRDAVGQADHRASVFRERDATGAATPVQVQTASFSSSSQVPQSVICQLPLNHNAGQHFAQPRNAIGGDLRLTHIEHLQRREVREMFDGDVSELRTLKLERLEFHER